MKVFSECIQAPLCNYYYYNKHFLCNNKGSLDFFFQVCWTNYNCPVLGAATWQFSSCGLQGLLDVLCKDNYFSCQRAWEMLKCTLYVIMTLLSCICNRSWCPQKVFQLIAGEHELCDPEFGRGMQRPLRRCGQAWKLETPGSQAETAGTPVWS